MNIFTSKALERVTGDLLVVMLVLGENSIRRISGFVLVMFLFMLIMLRLLVCDASKKQPAGLHVIVSLR